MVCIFKKSAEMLDSTCFGKFRSSSKTQYSLSSISGVFGGIFSSAISTLPETMQNDSLPAQLMDGAQGNNTFNVNTNLDTIGVPGAKDQSK